ncbi:hypothetical protein BGZ63DRAFT_394891 [Mariannaea sp. PMI_226]|nr:hypothetical protein BGZ63DRAFT_394891 [Mariannaea sp. PMI_226]
MAEDDDGWTARRWAKSEGHVTLAQQLKPAKHRPFAQAWRYCASKLGTPFTPDAG